MTQTRDKLAHEGIQNQAQAIQAHGHVGKEVRNAIKRIGGTLSEQVPPAELIKEFAKRIKKTTPKLELDVREAGVHLGKDQTTVSLS